MQVLDGTRKAVDAIHNIIETENTGPRILAQMREDLARLAVLDVRRLQAAEGRERQRLRRQRRPHRFSRLRAVEGAIPPAPGWSDRCAASLNEVGYRLRQNPELKDFLQLYRREDSAGRRSSLPGRQSFTLLYDRVVAFQLAYAAEPELNPTWKDDWDSKSREALPFAIEVFLEIEVQPRRSLESLGILGANLARLQYEDVIVIPEETRWRFRHRMHPARIDGGAEGQAAAAEGEGQGQGEGTGDAVPSGAEGEPLSPSRGQGSSPRAPVESSRGG